MSEESSDLYTPELVWSGITHPGRFRKNNEDAFLALTFDAQEVRYLGKEGEGSLGQGDFIFAVSDGMGGANAGEYASRIAVDKITDLLPNTFEIAALGIDRGCGQILTELFTRIHIEMTQMGQHYEELSGMGATLSLCWFTPGTMYFGHVGDSRVYYAPAEDDFRQLTEDHTHVGSLVRQGVLTEYQARQRPDRNVLDQALGGRIQSIVPQIGSVKYSPGDRFALCTDGVTDGISSRRIETLVTDPPVTLLGANPAERLVNDAVAESGRDNATAVVVALA